MSTLKNITGFYPADPSNYTPGRSKPITKFCVHHSAGWEQTLRYLWQNPDRNASSTFYVSGSVREQYVHIEDTPWTNGNFGSNSESLTVEVRGDWRDGYYDQATLDNLAEVMYQSLKLYPNLSLIYHQDVSDGTTLCPADLKLKEYALQQWNKAKNRIAVENQAAQQPAGLRVDIPDKKVIVIRDTNLWDMSFTSFANAKAVKALPKGTVIDVAGVYDHPLSNTDYYLSNYSWNNGINNGINRADCEDYVPPVITTPDPVTHPSEPTPDAPKEGSGTVDPVPVDPEGNPLEKRVGALEALVQKIVDFLSSIFTNFKK